MIKRIWIAIFYFAMAGMLACVPEYNRFPVIQCMHKHDRPDASGSIKLVLVDVSENDAIYSEYPLLKNSKLGIRTQILIGPYFEPIIVNHLPPSDDYSLILPGTYSFMRRRINRIKVHSGMITEIRVTLIYREKWAISD